MGSVKSIFDRMKKIVSSKSVAIEYEHNQNTYLVS